MYSTPIDEVDPVIVPGVSFATMTHHFSGCRPQPPIYIQGPLVNLGQSSPTSSSSNETKSSSTLTGDVSTKTHCSDSSDKYGEHNECSGSSHELEEKKPKHKKKGLKFSGALPKQENMQHDGVTPLVGALSPEEATVFTNPEKVPGGSQEAKEVPVEGVHHSDI